MKKFITKGSLVASAVLFAGISAYTFSGQAPAQRTGSPASSGVTCANSSCHSGPAATDQSITITTDIPTSGFVDNTDYNITITADRGTAAAMRAGFQVSIEGAGAHQGSIVAINSNTTLTGLNKYITHKGKQVFTNDKSEWIFKWNSGTGAQTGTTIYTAVNFANNNNNKTGDVIATETLSLTAASGIGISEDFIADVKLYPNPTSDFIQVKFSALGFEKYDINLYGIDGRLLNTLFSDDISGAFNQRFDVSSYAAGTYILMIESAGKVSHQKLFIQ